MKLIIAAAALLGASSFVAVTAPAMAQASMESCQPLTNENYEACCAAGDWNSIVRSEDQAYCPPSATGDQVRLGKKFGEEKNEGPTDASDKSDVQESTGSINNQQGGNNNKGGNANEADKNN